MLILRVKKTILIFSALTIAILLLFKFSAYSYLSGSLAVELVLGAIALVFFFIGLYINKRKAGKQPVVKEEIDHNMITQLGISNREYEVLVHLSKGMSNKEIAESLFVSESTIKTHVSNLLVKLDAKRRTQAIQKAKTLHLLTN